jgi:predicted transcriptional regulator
MADTVSLSFRVSKDTAERLEQLAAAMDRPRSWLLGRAVDEYLEAQAWQVAEIRRGMEEISHGQGVPHEKVVAWLETWGTDEETEPPA